jgi:hypothetical protein
MKTILTTAQARIQMATTIPAMIIAVIASLLALGPSCDSVMATSFNNPLYNKFSKKKISKQKIVEIAS